MSYNETVESKESIQIHKWSNYNGNWIIYYPFANHYPLDCTVFQSVLLIQKLCIYESRGEVFTQNLLKTFLYFVWHEFLISKIQQCKVVLFILIFFILCLKGVCNIYHKRKFKENFKGHNALHEGNKCTHGYHSFI